MDLYFRNSGDRQKDCTTAYYQIMVGTLRSGRIETGNQQIFSMKSELEDDGPLIQGDIVLTNLLSLSTSNNLFKYSW